MEYHLQVFDKLNKCVTALQSRFPREFGSRNTSFEKVAQMKMHESRKAIQYTMVAILLYKEFEELFGPATTGSRGSELRSALWSLIAGIHLIGGYTHQSPSQVIFQWVIQVLGKCADFDIFSGENLQDPGVTNSVTQDNFYFFFFLNIICPDIW
jgi:hypothetical protein